MATSPGTTPRWAAHLKQLCDEARRSPDSSRANPLRLEIWRITHLSLTFYTRRHAARLGNIEPEDVEDIASQKSLELLRDKDDMSGRLGDIEAPGLASYLSTIARNAVIDLLKTRGRRAVVEGMGEGSAERYNAAARGEGPEAQVESADFARALQRCAGGLDSRARRMWFLRVFYDMSSREIAAHPEIKLKPSHVDVVLNRSRKAIRNCMKRKGYTPRDMPQGTFVALWRMFHGVPEQSEKSA